MNQQSTRVTFEGTSFTLDHQLLAYWMALARIADESGLPVDLPCLVLFSNVNGALSQKTSSLKAFATVWLFDRGVRQKVRVLVWRTWCLSEISLREL
jgi:hypothetical protein